MTLAAKVGPSCRRMLLPLLWPHSLPAVRRSATIQQIRRRDMAGGRVAAASGLHGSLVGVPVVVDAAVLTVARVATIAEVSETDPPRDVAVKAANAAVGVALLVLVPLGTNMGCAPLSLSTRSSRLTKH